MKLIRYPNRDEWPRILERPAAGTGQVEAAVCKIHDDVLARGDEALREYGRRFDFVAINDFLVTKKEISEAGKKVSRELKGAMKVAYSNIEKFHKAQIETEVRVETTPGVSCWRRSVAIERVGLYVPSGSAPLISTVLMLGVPAQLAGCKDIAICSPPDANGEIHPAILFAAELCGVTRVFKVGGAQAIVALAYGTESIPKVGKIFGPGNQYVTCAKLLVSNEVAIDMPAGPSEVAVVADETAVPEFVAADLLSQAEHGPDSQVLLVSTSESLIEKTLAELRSQIETLPRKEFASASIANSRAVLVADLDLGLDLVNEYAPEHLILAVDKAESIAERVVNAGSVFIGNYSCESVGDYASGTNHTLPTAGFARSFSGVSVDSFVKKITFQKLTREGIQNIGPVVEVMAREEGLEAHRRAVAFRITRINALRVNAADGINETEAINAV